MFHSWRTAITQNYNFKDILVGEDFEHEGFKMRGNKESPLSFSQRYRVLRAKFFLTVVLIKLLSPCPARASACICSTMY